MEFPFVVVAVVLLRLKCHFTIINYVVCVCVCVSVSNVYALKFNKQIVNVWGDSISFVHSIFWNKQNSAKRYLYFEWQLSLSHFGRSIIHILSHALALALTFTQTEATFSRYRINSFIKFKITSKMYTHQYNLINWHCSTRLISMNENDRVCVCTACALMSNWVNTHTLSRSHTQHEICLSFSLFILYLKHTATN